MFYQVEFAFLLQLDGMTSPELFVNDMIRCMSVLAIWSTKRYRCDIHEIQRRVRMMHSLAIEQRILSNTADLDDGIKQSDKCNSQDAPMLLSDNQLIEYLANGPTVFLINKASWQLNFSNPGQYSLSAISKPSDTDALDISDAVNIDSRLIALAISVRQTITSNLHNHALNASESNVNVKKDGLKPKSDGRSSKSLSNAKGTLKPQRQINHQSVKDVMLASTKPTDDERLILELVVLCAATLYWAQDRTLSVTDATTRTLSLYSRCLEENDILTGSKLSMYERQKYMDALIPSGGLAEFFLTHPYPVYVDNAGIFQLELVSDCKEVIHQNPVDTSDMPQQLRLRQLAADWNYVLHTPLTYVPKLLPLLLDMAKTFESTLNKSPSKLKSKSKPETPIQVSVASEGHSSKPLPKTLKSPLRTSQASPFSSASKPSVQGNSVSTELNVRQFPKIRIQVIVCALCVYFVEDKSCFNNDLGSPLRDFHEALSNWLLKTNQEEIESLPKLRSLGFLNLIDPILVVIRGEIWTLSRSAPLKNGLRKIFLNMVVNPTPQEIADAIPIQDSWVDFAQECFEDESSMSDEDTIEPNDSSPEALDLLTVEAPAPVQVYDLETALDLQNFYEEFTRLAGQPDRREFVDKVQKILNQAYNNTAHVYLFGSSVNNLGLNTSDVDMTIEISPELISNHKAKNMHHLAGILRAGGMKEVVAISHARVPICKFYDPKLCVHADINVGHSLGVYNSALLKAYTLLDPRVKPFILLIKLWSKARDLNNPSSGGTLSSYAYSIMAIAYMQKLGLLPSLQLAVPPGTVSVAHVPCPTIRARGKRNESGKKGAPLMREVDVTFEHNLDSPLLRKYTEATMLLGWDNIDDIFRSPRGVVALFYGFMRYFGYEHVYDASNCVSIKDGTGFKTVTTDQASKGKRGRNGNLVLVVEDPFEADRNCTRNTTTTSLIRLLKEFRRAADLVGSDTPGVVNELLVPVVCREFTSNRNRGGYGLNRRQSNNSQHSDDSYQNSDRRRSSASYNGRYHNSANSRQNATSTNGQYQSAANRKQSTTSTGGTASSTNWRSRSSIASDHSSTKRHSNPYIETISEAGVIATAT
ncbi:hypothetical protein O5D80_008580 [Batrachochytrium dendrobatidis]|nr:hypothetical protein O5D80_008580 [Batrachochytrium dendrobatidis]